MRILLLLVAANAASNVAFASVPLKINGPTMGTYYSIVVDSPPEDMTAEKLQPKVKALLTKINQQMSTWDETSEISKFNQSASTDWFEVSAEFATVTAEAKRIHDQTNGAFDPTVSPLIDLWGFGDGRKKSIPGEAEISAAKDIIGMQHLTVRLDPPAIKKATSQLQLNLSAIAKGYGVDAIADLLTNEGLPSFVVDIGGENRTGTVKESGDPWNIGIESPLGGLKRVVKLTDAAIATSGDYRNYFEMDGATYSHAIDPDTGWPVKNPPASVSVIHESCMTADAWATAMMVLGTEKGMQVAAVNQLSVVFQEVDGEAIKETATEAFLNAGPVAKTIATEAEASPAEEQHTAAEPKPAAAKWFPFVAAAAIFLIAITGMAIGTILQNKSIKGSCGGLASMPGSEGKSICELCTIPKDECTNAELREMMQASSPAECDDHNS